MASEEGSSPAVLAVKRSGDATDRTEESSARPTKRSRAGEEDGDETTKTITTTVPHEETTTTAPLTTTEPPVSTPIPTDATATDATATDATATDATPTPTSTTLAAPPPVYGARKATTDVGALNGGGGGASSTPPTPSLSSMPSPEPSTAIQSLPRQRGRKPAPRTTDYEEGKPFPKVAVGSFLKVHIPAKYLTTSNKRVRTRQLWGTDVYTWDSDLVAVVVHSGHFTPTPQPPSFTRLSVTLRALSPQASYLSSSRNNLRSRRWGSVDMPSFRVEKCVAVDEGTNKVIELIPARSSKPPHVSGPARPGVVGLQRQTIVVKPPVKGGRNYPDLTLQFSLSNDPWLKYTQKLVGDWGLEPATFTSRRLKQDTVFLEGPSQRYELCRDGVKGYITSQGTTCFYDTYKLARVYHPTLMDRQKILDLDVPLTEEYVETVESDIDWAEIEWGDTSFRLRNAEYPLQRIQFIRIHKAGEEFVEESRGEEGEEEGSGVMMEKDEEEGEEGEEEEEKKKKGEEEDQEREQEREQGQEQEQEPQPKPDEANGSSDNVKVELPREGDVGIEEAVVEVEVETVMEGVEENTRERPTQ